MKALLRVMGLLSPFLYEVALSLLLGVAAIAANIGLLGTAAFLIASAALHPSIADLQVAIVGVRFFGISRGVFRYLERLVSHSLNLCLTARLRVDFYRRIEPGAPVNLQTRRSGDLLGRAMGDLETLENFYVRALAPVVVALVVTAGMSLTLGGYLPEIGLIMAAGLLVNGFLLPGVTLLVSRRTVQELTASRATLSAQLVELMQGFEDLQTNTADTAWIERVRETAHITARQQNRLGVLNAANGGLLLLVMNVTLLVVLWIAIPAVGRAALSGVSLAVVTVLVLASFEAVSTLPAAAQQFNASREAAGRLFEIDSSVEESTVGALSPVSELEFKQVSYQYPGESEPALQEISFRLARGERIAIVGASGAGKTTLLNILLSFVYPQHGEITLDQMSAQQISPQSQREQFAWLSQTPYLFNTSLRENLQLAKADATDAEMLEALSKAGLSDWLALQPQGFDTWVGEGGAHLSAGERQRFAIARMLLQPAGFLLLDEPTANLDPLTELEVLRTMWECAADKGMLWITHRLTLLEGWEQILVFERGRIVEQGSYADLMNRQGRFASLVKLETNLLEPNPVSAGLEE